MGTSFRPDQMYGLPGQGMSLPQWLVDPITDDEMATRFPGTNGDPVSAPDVRLPRAPRTPTPQDITRALQPYDRAMAPPASSPQGPGWQARLFGGADPLAGGMLNPQDARGQGRQALRDFGINLLMNSGPHPFKRGLGELVGTALQAGQQSYQQGVQTVGQRLQAAREMALRDRQAAVAEQNANTQAAFATRGRTPPRPIRDASAKDAAGNPIIRYLDPETLQVLREDPRYERPRAPSRTELGRLSPGESNRLQTFNELVNLSIDLVGEDGQSGLIGEHPGSFGLLRMGPDALNVRANPEGAVPRSTLSNLRTAIRLARSGAAVTPSEGVQLEAMLPAEGDPDEIVRVKVNNLLVHLRRLSAGARTRGGTTDIEDVTPTPRVNF